MKGIDDLTMQELQDELSRGGRFVTFDYCFSLLLVTFRRSSDVHFIRAGEGTFLKALPFTLISLLFGWWGFPWGFIYTPGAIFTNLTGGRNVTANVLKVLSAQTEVAGEPPQHPTPHPPMHPGQSTAPPALACPGCHAPLDVSNPARPLNVTCPACGCALVLK